MMNKPVLTSPIREDRQPLEDLIPLDRPLRVLIDPADICNFKCEFCFQSYDSAFRGTVMKDTIFDKVVEQLKEFGSPINIVHLYGFGEPLINKNLPKYVAKLKTENVAKEVAITSNGSLLTHELAVELVAAGLDRLSISLNGLSNEDFVRIAKAKVNFERLYEELEYFYTNRGKCHLHIKINQECFQGDDQEKFITLFSHIADTINIDHVVDVWPEMSINKSAVSMYGSEIVENGKIVCPQMFYEFVIHADGSVSPCCADYLYYRTNLGNIENTTLKQIWNGEQLYEMRVKTLKGETINYPACHKCKYPMCASTVNITQSREKLLEKINKDYYIND